MSMPWPVEDDDLSPRARERKRQWEAQDAQRQASRDARAREDEARRLATPSPLDAALRHSGVAHLRWGTGYFIVSARVPWVGYTLAYVRLPGEGAQDVASLKTFPKEEAMGKLRAARVRPEDAIWLPVHEGNDQDPYALPDTVSARTASATTGAA